MTPRLTEAGFKIVAGTPAGFAAFQAWGTERWRAVSRRIRTFLPRAHDIHGLRGPLTPSLRVGALPSRATGDEIGAVSPRAET